MPPVSARTQLGAWRALQPCGVTIGVGVALVLVVVAVEAEPTATIGLGGVEVLVESEPDEGVAGAGL
jgi:hypothetical protein